MSSEHSSGNPLIDYRRRMSDPEFQLRVALETHDQIRRLLSSNKTNTFSDDPNFLCSLSSAQAFAERTPDQQMLEIGEIVSNVCKRLAKAHSIPRWFTSQTRQGVRYVA